ncbi:hypothetical protein CXF79_11065 [Colwellia sp. Bg11-28]|nr:hypothetical protein CXF79_11065 [Colwellia sp. Bg11-28]
MKKPSERDINILVLIFVFISLLISSLASANKGTDEIKNKFIFKQTSLSFQSFKSTVSSK